MMFRMSGTPWRSLYSFEEGSPYVLDAISEPERRLAPEIWIQTGTVYQKCSFRRREGYLPGFCRLLSTKPCAIAVALAM